MKAYIECTVREIEEGRRYAGPISIGRGKFDFDLRLAGSLSLLSRRHPIIDFEGERLVYQLSLSKEGQAIKLTNEEFYFFLSVIYPFATGCFIQLLCKRSVSLFANKSIYMSLGMSITGQWFLACSPDSCEVTFHGDYGCTVAECAMLDDPKFGCACSIGF